MDSRDPQPFLFSAASHGKTERFAPRRLKPSVSREGMTCCRWGSPAPRRVPSKTSPLAASTETGRTESPPNSSAAKSCSSPRLRVKPIFGFASNRLRARKRIIVKPRSTNSRYGATRQGTRVRFLAPIAHLKPEIRGKIMPSVAVSIIGDIVRLANFPTNDDMTLSLRELHTTVLDLTASVVAVGVTLKELTSLKQFNGFTGNLDAASNTSLQNWCWTSHFSKSWEHISRDRRLARVGIRSLYSSILYKYVCSMPNLSRNFLPTSLRVVVHRRSSKSDPASTDCMRGAKIL